MAKEFGKMRDQLIPVWWRRAVLPSLPCCLFSFFPSKILSFFLTSWERLRRLATPHGRCGRSTAGGPQRQSGYKRLPGVMTAKESNGERIKGARILQFGNQTKYERPAGSDSEGYPRSGLAAHRLPPVCVQARAPRRIGLILHVAPLLSQCM